MGGYWREQKSFTVRRVGGVVRSTISTEHQPPSTEKEEANGQEEGGSVNSSNTWGEDVT